MSAFLVERLRAALDRAEEIARAAMVSTTWDGKAHRPRPTDGRWTANGCYVEGDGIEIYDEGGHNEDQAAHIAANDPAHVLRSVAAHRKIIAMCKFMIDSRDADPSNWNPAVSAEHILDDLAAVYFPEAPDA